VVMKYRSIKDSETGLRKQIQVPKRIKPWWFASESGKVCVSIPYGAQLIELAKGELGAQIETASSALKAGFPKRGV